MRFCFGKFLKFVLGFLKNLMLGLVLKYHLLKFAVYSISFTTKAFHTDKIMNVIGTIGTTSSV